MIRYYLVCVNPIPPSKLAILPFKLDPLLLAKMDQARGSKTRSFFIRESIANYLRSLGTPVEDDIVYPPDRTRLDQHYSPSVKLNDEGHSLSLPSPNPPPFQP